MGCDHTRAHGFLSSCEISTEQTGINNNYDLKKTVKISISSQNCPNHDTKKGKHKTSKYLLDQGPGHSYICNLMYLMILNVPDDLKCLTFTFIKHILLSNN